MYFLSKLCVLPRRHIKFVELNTYTLKFQWGDWENVTEYCSRTKVSAIGELNNKMIFKKKKEACSCYLTHTPPQA